MNQMTVRILLIAVGLFLALVGTGSFPELAAQGQSKPNDEASRPESSQMKVSPEENPEAFREKLKAEEKKIPFSAIAMSLRNLYMDTEPRLRKLELLRDSNALDDPSDEISALTQEVRRETRSGLSSIRSRIENAATDHKNSDNLQQLMHSASYLEDYVSKQLNNWSPTKEERMKMRAWRRSKQLKEGLATPKLLRKMFLNNLVGYIYFQHTRLDSFPPSAWAIHNYKKETRKMFTRIFQKFITLTARIREVKQKLKEEEKEKNKKDSANNGSARSGNSKDKTGEKEGRENQVKKQLREVRREAYQEWSKKLEKFKSSRKKTLNRLNRLLMLFRERDKMTSLESNMKMNALRLKRRFDVLFEADESGNIFRNKKKLRGVLIEAGIFYTEAVERVKERKRPLYIRKLRNTLNGVIEKGSEVSDRKAYRKTVKNVSGKLEEDFGKDPLHSLSDWNHEGVRAISNRLKKDYGKKEQRLGTFVGRFRKAAKDLQNWIKNANKGVKKVVALYKGINYSEKKKPGKVLKKAVQKIKNIKKRIYKSSREIVDRFSSLTREKQRILSEFTN